MLQRNEMGRKFRQHFIAIEEAWNSPDKVMERALQIAHRRAHAIEIRRCETNDERFGTVNSYPITAWEAYLEVSKWLS